MKFKTYDILSSLIPGFLILIVLLRITNFEFNKDLIVPYTAIAFLLGYIINTFSSWLEDIYYFSWKGKPSNRLLEGKGIWKIHFYQHADVKEMLLKETKTQNPSNNELFNIAMRYANTSKDNRVDEFSSSYAFSRSLLTCVIFSIILFSYKEYNNWQFYLISLSVLFVFWLRCKQRSYYYSKEVLNAYYKLKNDESKL